MPSTAACPKPRRRQLMIANHRRGGGSLWGRQVTNVVEHVGHSSRSRVKAFPQLPQYRSGWSSGKCARATSSPCLPAMPSNRRVCRHSHAIAKIWRPRVPFLRQPVWSFELVPDGSRGARMKVFQRFENAAHGNGAVVDSPLPACERSGATPR